MEGGEEAEWSEVRGDGGEVVVERWRSFGGRDIITLRWAMTFLMKL